MKHRLKQWARKIKQDTLTLWYAYRHPGTPMLAKILAILVVVYVFSPIDLIPDFIPVLGLLDDVLLLPLGILLAVRLIPADVLRECRHAATKHLAEGAKKPVSRGGLVAIIGLWIACALLVGWLVLR